MARMTDDAERRRAEVENALAVLARAKLLLHSQVSLRLRQAIQRDAQLGALLHPAIEQLGEIDQALSKAQGILGADWRIGQRAGWRRGKNVQ